MIENRDVECRPFADPSFRFRRVPKHPVLGFVATKQIGLSRILLLGVLGLGFPFSGFPFGFLEQHEFLARSLVFSSSV